jgi:hypothetical protein
MKNKVIISGLIILLAVMTNGCGYTISQYGASINNVESLKSFNTKVKINDFSSSKPGLSSITCRLAGPIETPNKVSYEQYIKEAFVIELKLAGIYSEDAKLVLNGHLEEVDFDSNIGAGKWKFTLKMTSNKNESVVISSIYEFSTNWVADKACQQVAQAFTPAVQKLIHDIVTNPEFGKLL